MGDVARAADVSEVTVFNYFPTKEDLFFGGMAAFEAELVEAVRRRDEGESALVAFRRPIEEGCEHLALDDRTSVIVRAANLIGASEALQAREREVVAGYTRLLAAALAEERGQKDDDVEAWTVATALMGAHRSVVASVRNRVLAGRRGRPLATDARSMVRRAFARLEGGIADYAIR